MARSIGLSDTTSISTTVPPDGASTSTGSGGAPSSETRAARMGENLPRRYVRMPIFQPEVELQDPEQRAGQQAERLKALLERLANADSPYWRAKLDGIEPHAALSDLPFTVKAELRDTFPFGMLAVPLSDTVRIHASSGTHGKPTIVAYTAADVELFAEVNARAIACAGGGVGDVLHVAYGYGLLTGGLGLHYGGERLGATVVPASGGNVPLQLELLADLGAAGIACTPSFCLLLAERAREHGLLERIRLRYRVLGAEPGSEAMRAKVEG